MINLLPPRAKKEFRKEYLLRLGIIVLWAAFILEIFSVIIFLPSYYILHLDAQALANSLEQQKILAPVVDASVPAQLASIKGELDLLKPSGVKEVVFSQLLEDIVAIKPRGIGLSAIAYTWDKGVTSIQITGTAETRDELLTFQKLLATPKRTANFGGRFIIKKFPSDFSVIITYN
jgi:hypothetical protein